MIEARSLDIRPVELEATQELAQKVGCSTLLAHLLRGREQVDPQLLEHYFKPFREDLYPPELYPGVPQAVELLEGALARGERVFICGDYDVDGITATSILVLGLRQVGLEVGFHLPHRFAEGFGLSKAGVEEALKFGAKLLMTVDCGSANAEEVAYAQREGLKVVITDHHQLEGVLPQPEAFVNANLPGHQYPFTKLCGAGVAWKLLSALYAKLGRPEPEEYLDLVALATLCDMVPMRGENRTLTMLGMPVLARLERPALQVLTQACKLYPEAINAQAVGFSLGPKINACGRMDTPNWALELFLSQDPELCQSLVGRLLELSEDRHRVESETLKEIEAYLRQHPVGERKSIFVWGEWHRGVVGLCAQRLMDTYRRPVFIATLSEGQIVGSARAPREANLLEIMKLCEEHFSQYGGHANAGGFTVAPGHQDLLGEALEAACQRLAIPLAHKKVDCILPLHKLNLGVVRELNRLEPTGKENEKPLFLARGVQVVAPLKPMGKFGTSVALQIKDAHFPLGRKPLKAVAFNKLKDLAHLDLENCTLDLLYMAEENIWGGKSELQGIIHDFVAPDYEVSRLLPPPESQHGVFASYEEAQRTLSDSAAQAPTFWREVFGGPPPQGQIVDGRRVLNKKLYLERLLQAEPEAAVLVLCEGGLESLGAEEYGERLQSLTPLELYGQWPTPPRGGSYQHLVLWAPPLQRELLRRLPPGSRVHLLFQGAEIAKWLKKISPYMLDRQVMAKIYRWLVQVTANGRRLWPAERLAAGARELKLEVLTLRRALKVLEQLELVTWREGAVSWQAPRAEGKLELNASPLYQSASSLKGDLQGLAELCGRLYWQDSDFS